MASRKTSVQFDVVHSDSENENETEPAGKVRRGAPTTKRKKQLSHKARGLPTPKPKKKQRVFKPAAAGALVKAIRKRRSAVSKKGKITGVRASAEVIMKFGTKLNKAIDDTWALAPKARMYLRKCKKDPSKTRTQSLIRNAAIDIAASGAAADIFAKARVEGKLYNLPVPYELTHAPWHPATSKGARIQINMVVAAFAQQALRNAVLMRDNSRKKRISADMMNHAFELAGPQLFNAGNLGVSGPTSFYLGECKAEGDKERKESAQKRSMAKAVQNSAM